MLAILSAECAASSAALVRSALLLTGAVFQFSPLPGFFLLRSPSLSGCSFPFSTRFRFALAAYLAFGLALPFAFGLVFAFSSGEGDSDA